MPVFLWSDACAQIPFQTALKTVDLTTLERFLLNLKWYVTLMASFFNKLFSTNLRYLIP